ncbi:MAG: NAD(P)-dependent oxidoreductase [Acinetobacter populi]|jgi:3-hydroxyisobutyrate dehydrogenase|uniref:NAD(P)-dependent oxidoreductase n=1 Tax=Acinetobacter populi TaxID=1582270 RepID=UPI0023531E42|nr:NAD(P)-dependent oxidoreductase [Acinetobacter populi]MCH4247526.1 NAD(P)-dependent oxidoreductase [Acinetobacter populi]
MNTDKAIAFLGMGLMGSRMSKRLIDAGFKVAVWNRTASACEPIIAYGAEALELKNIGQYPIVMLCLADDAAVTTVVEHILPDLQENQICIDFSSLSVSATTQLAKKVSEKQVNWIDSPVSGGVAGAEQGTLVIFAGGDAKLIQALHPVYAPLAQRVTCMGATGTGQATKICNQLIVAASSTLIAEAVALAQNAGVDANLLAPALAGGFADSKPFQILSPRMASQNFEPVQWKVQTLSKDLNNAVNLADQVGLNLPMAAHALSQLQQHQQQGFAEKDLSTLILSIKSTI